MKLFVGIDGGGTKTEICVINAAGLELTRLSGGPSNPQAIGFDDAVRELTQLLNQALSSIREDDGGTGTPGPERSEELGGLDKREVLGECEKLDKLGAPGQRWELGLCLGMAGVDTHEDRERVTFAIRSYFEQTGVEAKLLVTNDAEIALMATLDRSFGVLAIAGTGSIVFGRTPDGDCYRVGGWGHLLGDEGSGYRIGLDTLHAVMRSYDGIDPPTAMTPMIEQAYGWERIVELRRYIYQPHIKKQDVAAFARYAIEAAAAGDPPARRLIERSAAAWQSKRPRLCASTLGSCRRTWCSAARSFGTASCTGRRFASGWRPLGRICGCTKRGKRPPMAPPGWRCNSCQASEHSPLQPTGATAAAGATAIDTAA